MAPFVSRRAVINISAACVVLLVLVQAVSWWQARRIHLAGAVWRAPGNLGLKPLTEGGTNNLPRLPEWKGQRSQLSGLVHEAVKWIPPANSSEPICLWEIGTANGKGTTLSVVKALSELGRATGRKWGVVGYEAMPEAAASAAKVWAPFSNVVIVNELMLTQDDLEEWVLPYIEGPLQDKYPGKDFYQRFYEATTSQIEAGSLGGWFKTALCRPHIVLIDSTRFAQIGILATVFRKTNSGVDNRTVFVIENDFWEDPVRGELNKQRDTLMFLGQELKMEVLASRKVPGERWPWFIMRGVFEGRSNSTRTAARRQRQQAKMQKGLSAAPGGADDVWGNSHKQAK